MRDCRPLTAACLSIPPASPQEPTPQEEAPLRVLKTIRISLILTGMSSAGQLGISGPDDQTRVLFEISIEGERVGCLEATADEVGLPLSLEQARRLQTEQNTLQLPNHILAALESVVPQNGWPLWLSFPLYSGYLPMMPWETLLKTRLNTPVLRLSYTEVQPIRPLSKIGQTEKARRVQRNT